MSMVLGVEMDSTTLDDRLRSQRTPLQLCVARERVQAIRPFNSSPLLLLFRVLLRLDGCGLRKAVGAPRLDRIELTRRDCDEGHAACQRQESMSRSRSMRRSESRNSSRRRRRVYPEAVQEAGCPGEE